MASRKAASSCQDIRSRFRVRSFFFGLDLMILFFELGNYYLVLGRVQTLNTPKIRPRNALWYGRSHQLNVFYYKPTTGRKTSLAYATTIQKNVIFQHAIQVLSSVIENLSIRIFPDLKGRRRIRRIRISTYLYAL